jgi:CubicO group peptidase (beta-lactamase class C family)
MKKIKILFISVITLISLGLVGSCQSKPAKTKQETTFQKIDSLLQNHVDLNHIPSAVAYISHHGDEVYNRAFGFKNIEDQLPATPNSLFRMASMTKALTAVSILQLMEKGKLNLNDPVKQYIPEFSNPQLLVEVLPDSSFTAKPAKNDITIQHLLTHTSGIGYGFQNEEYNKVVLKNGVSEGFCEDSRTSIENTRKIAALPLLAEPGEKNIYGMSYDVLGTLIEVVSGKRYDAYVSEHILRPLEMNDSYFLVPNEEQHRLVDVYEPNPNNEGIRLTTYEEVNYPILKHRQFFSGGADMVSTAKDYNKFLMMLVNKGKYGEHSLLTETSVEMMLSPQTPFNDGDSYQGFAAWVVNDKGAKNGLRPKGSYDFGGFFDTYCWVDPEQNFTAILLLQMYPTNAHDVHWEFQKSVYKIFEGIN